MKSGYVALLVVGLFDGAAATAAPRLAFLTSATGNGNLSTWADAGGHAGLAAGDAICVARATAANLPDPQSFVAWLSDSQNDAYCRVHGFGGKKALNCGQAALPTGAGPWRRTDGLPFMGSLSDITSTRAVYAPLLRDEFGAAVTTGLSILAGTSVAGELKSRTCGDWQDANADVDLGMSSATYPDWTDPAAFSFCVFSFRLACLQQGAGDPLPALPLPHGQKEAFITSLAFNGKLSGAAQAGGHVGVEAGDAICRSLAQDANLYEPQSYKAYLADGTLPSARFQFDGPWVRRDGLPFASSFAQIAGGYVTTPLNVTQTGSFSLATYAWTGIQSGSTPSAATCSGWGADTGGGQASVVSTSGAPWPVPYGSPTPSGCANTYALYCLSDSDLLFRSSLE